MPFTKEQQREHYLKNQELLKAKRRKRYFASKSQVEQNYLSKVEQSQVEQFSEVEKNKKVEQLLVKNVQPIQVEQKVEQNLLTEVEQNLLTEVEQIVQPTAEKPKVISVQPKSEKDLDLEAYNAEVYKRFGTTDPKRFFTFSDGRKIVRTSCGCNLKPNQDPKEWFNYTWCLDSCEYFTGWRNREIDRD